MYLFGETKQQLEQLERFLKTDYPRLRIAGKFAMEECLGDFDGVVNEINIATPDVIFSILPTPEQEYFLMENRGKINAKIWYGLGGAYARAQGVSYLAAMAKKMVHKGMLRSMLSKYNRKKEE